MSVNVGEAHPSPQFFTVASPSVSWAETDVSPFTGTLLHHTPRHLAWAAGGAPAHPTPDSSDYYGDARQLVPHSALGKVMDPLQPLAPNTSGKAPPGQNHPTPPAFSLLPPLISFGSRQLEGKGVTCGCMMESYGVMQCVKGAKVCPS